MDVKYASIIDGVADAYPGKSASVVVLCGSTLKTEFGYFGPLAIPAEDCSEMSVEAMLAHLETQRANVEAIVFTGSEPLQQYEALAALCQQLKRKGFAIKLETTGFYADNLERLLPFIDAVAMDVKAEFDANKYAELTGFRGEPATLMQDTLRSILILKDHKLKKPDFFVEFRTTIIPSVNDTELSMEKIAKEIPFADKYALQQFVSESKLADESLRKYGTSSKIKLIELAAVARRFVQNVFIRTKEEGEEQVD